MVLLFAHGLDDQFSIFEHLMLMGLISYSKSTKRYKVRLSAAGQRPMAPVAIDAAAALEAGSDGVLADDDDPELDGRENWPAFVAANGPAVEALWQRGVKLMFSDSAPADIDAEGAEDDSDDIDDDAGKLD